MISTNTHRTPDWRCVFSCIGRKSIRNDAFAKVLGRAAAHSNIGVILAAHQRRTEAEAEFKALAIQGDLPQPRTFLAHFEQPANAR